mmetsp:Transcript_14126/g.44115  ORF Transcript_14126/g.44115 Transcript_14126/m.44115 type:complete len:211 (-) Transcript_14126:612-1244(-)
MSQVLGSAPPSHKPHELARGASSGGAPCACSGSGWCDGALPAGAARVETCADGADVGPCCCQNAAHAPPSLIAVAPKGWAAPDAPPAGAQCVWRASSAYSSSERTAETNASTGREMQRRGSRSSRALSAFAIRCSSCRSVRCERGTRSAAALAAAMFAAAAAGWCATGARWGHAEAGIGGANELPRCVHIAAGASGNWPSACGVGGVEKV